MTLTTENYLGAQQHWPVEGQHILGQQSDTDIIVYQAYKPSIADFAVANQYLGGSNYSYNRMSWIKPNFLWMMYRCGWASKPDQERVLAIRISKTYFESILAQAIRSSFDPLYNKSHEQWKEELANKEVRLQWDPDHDPYGNKLSRRAIQLGLKGDMLERFGKQEIKAIADITDFVNKQKVFVNTKQLALLEVPVERVFKPADPSLCAQVGID